jgi:hypothetical protein
MMAKKFRKMVIDEYKELFESLEQGERFLCRRFLKMSEEVEQHEHVFDRDENKFIHFVDAVIEYLTVENENFILEERLEGRGKRKRARA